MSPDSCHSLARTRAVLPWRNSPRAYTACENVQCLWFARTLNHATFLPEQTQATAGTGLTSLIQEEFEDTLKALQSLVNGAQAISVENLEAAGSVTNWTRAVGLAATAAALSIAGSVALGFTVPITVFRDRVGILRKAVMLTRPSPIMWKSSTSVPSAFSRI
jgi:hypothetical protein